ncbi:outer membrane lipoprotein carrier protein LolA [Parapedobacter sp. 10938]|uniref:outer membrane lipoprotein carrier protein LolA n=1 Tax=Parapedobacter flavus TaxID=3110225 RepID=UPI002DBCDA71|nr:outer membrane lipoprotein carrier protein LolA [Parapedobacter sp. 10938]MEC3881146.1 outer membrane lipoprotein carrier protein LolA [Parapedobacter sp. 10938]
MHIRKHDILALALLLCCTTGFAQHKALNTEESAALKAKITASTQNLQSLQSDFTQTKQLSYMDNAIRSTGKLYFKAPGKIRWEYVSPTNYVVIFDGQTMHTVEGGRTKTTNLTANRRMKRLNDLLAGSVQNGNMLDESRFDITYYRDKADYVAVLVPKDKGLSRFIRQVALTFDGTSLLLTRVTLTDPAGDTTQLAFANQRKNATIPGTVFEP